MSYIVLPIKTAQMQEAFHSSQALGSAGLKAVETHFRVETYLQPQGHRAVKTLTAILNEIL